MNTDPGRLELLGLLRSELDDSLVEEMAASDGGMGKEQNLQAFVEILQTGRIPCPLEGNPGEVCNLMRWETVKFDAPLSREERRYLVSRLFASWILVNAYASPERRDNGYTDDGDAIVLRNVVEISVALGPAFVRASTRFVAWAQSEGMAAHDPVENLFYLLSMVVLRCASQDKDEIAAALAVYDTLVVEEQRVRRQLSEDPCPFWGPRPAWLFGLYGGFYGGYEPLGFLPGWARIGVWVLNRLAASASGALDPRFAEMKCRLLEGIPEGKGDAC